MPRHDTLYVGLLLLILNTIGCDNAEDNSTPSDRDSETQRDTGSEMAHIPTATEIENEWGFPMRIPDTPALTCDVFGDYRDIDFICTIEHEALSGTIYIQNSPTRCNEHTFPTYESPLALIRINGTEKLERLSDPLFEIYEAGANSQFEFDYGDRNYLYDHSVRNEFGRFCHLSDCLVVSDKEIGELIQDGCYPSRTLPIVCVIVNIDGSFEPLVDTLPQECPSFG